MLMMIRYVSLAALAASLVLVLGCGANNRVAEELIKSRAKELIGPAQDYDVDVSGATKSKVQRLSVLGRMVEVQTGLVVDEMALKLTDVSYKLKPTRILKVGDSALTARVAESAVNTYLARRDDSGQRVRSLRVHFLQDAVRVSGKLRTKIIDIPVSTTGRLVARGAQVDYEPTALEVAGIGIPAGILDDIARFVNPIVDLSGRNVTPRIETITLTPGGMSVAGTAVITDAP